MSSELEVVGSNPTPSTHCSQVRSDRDEALLRVLEIDYFASNLDI